MGKFLLFTICLALFSPKVYGQEEQPIPCVGQLNGSHLLADKKTDLHLFIRFGQDNLATRLIAKGAGINVKDSQGETPLHLAIKFEEDILAALLIQEGVDIEARDNNCKTPLHLAIERGRDATATLLISEGADVQAEDSSGQTPLDIALQMRNFKMARLLEDNFLQTIKVRLFEFKKDSDPYNRQN